MHSESVTKHAAPLGCRTQQALHPRLAIHTSIYIQPLWAQRYSVSCVGEVLQKQSKQKLRLEVRMRALCVFWIGKRMQRYSVSRVGEVLQKQSKQKLRLEVRMCVCWVLEQEEDAALWRKLCW